MVQTGSHQDLRLDSIEGRAWRASSQLLVNLNVNEQDDGSDNVDLLNCIFNRTLSWHDRNGSVLRSVPSSPSAFGSAP